MKIFSVLLFSNSIVYKKIITACVKELMPGTEITRCSSEELCPLLQENKYGMIIIDMASGADVKAFVKDAIDYGQAAQVIVLCEQKSTDIEAFAKLSDENFSVSIKPLNEGYETNYKAVRRAINLGLIKNRRINRENTADTKPETTAVNTEKKAIANGDYSLLLIAASTGGPQALGQVLSNINTEINIPCLVVQHMPAGFTKTLASNIDRSSRLKVLEAQEAQEITNNKVLIAPGGYHMKVTSNKTIALEQTELVNGVRPAADVLFSSVAKEYKGENILVVILTGMGSDGTVGVSELKKACNCVCIAQNEATCTIYGMPRSVVDAHLADIILPLSKIADEICEIIKPNTRAKQSGETDD